MNANRKCVNSSKEKKRSKRQLLAEIEKLQKEIQLKQQILEQIEKRKKAKRKREVLLSTENENVSSKFSGSFASERCPSNTAECSGAECKSSNRSLLKRNALAIGSPSTEKAYNCSVSSEFSSEKITENFPEVQSEVHIESNSPASRSRVENEEQHVEDTASFFDDNMTCLFSSIRNVEDPFDFNGPDSNEQLHHKPHNATMPVSSDNCQEEKNLLVKPSTLRNSRRMVKSQKVMPSTIHGNAKNSRDTQAFTRSNASHGLIQNKYVDASTSSKRTSEPMLSQKTELSSTLCIDSEASIFDGKLYEELSVREKLNVGCSPVNETSELGPNLEMFNERSSQSAEADETMCFTQRLKMGRERAQEICSSNENEVHDTAVRFDDSFERLMDVELLETATSQEKELEKSSQDKNNANDSSSNKDLLKLLQPAPFIPISALVAKMETDNDEESQSLTAKLLDENDFNWELSQLPGDHLSQVASPAIESAGNLTECHMGNEKDKNSRTEEKLSTYVENQAMPSRCSGFISESDEMKNQKQKNLSVPLCEITKCELQSLQPEKTDDSSENQSDLVVDVSNLDPSNFVSLSSVSDQTRIVPKILKDILGRNEGTPKNNTSMQFQSPADQAWRENQFVTQNLLKNSKFSVEKSSKQHTEDHVSLKGFQTFNKKIRGCQKTLTTMESSIPQHSLELSMGSKCIQNNVPAMMNSDFHCLVKEDQSSDHFFQKNCLVAAPEVERPAYSLPNKEIGSILGDSSTGALNLLDCQKSVSSTSNNQQDLSRNSTFQNSPSKDFHKLPESRKCQKRLFSQQKRTSPDSGALDSSGEWEAAMKDYALTCECLPDPKITECENPGDQKSKSDVASSVTEHGSDPNRSEPSNDSLPLQNNTNLCEEFEDMLLSNDLDELPSLWEDVEGNGASTSKTSPKQENKECLLHDSERNKILDSLMGKFESFPDHDCQTWAQKPKDVNPSVFQTNLELLCHLSKEQYGQKSISDIEVPLNIRLTDKIEVKESDFHNETYEEKVERYFIDPKSHMFRVLCAFRKEPSFEPEKEMRKMFHPNTLPGMVFQQNMIAGVISKHCRFKGKKFTTQLCLIPGQCFQGLCSAPVEEMLVMHSGVSYFIVLFFRAALCIMHQRLACEWNCMYTCMFEKEGIFRQAVHIQDDKQIVLIVLLHTVSGGRKSVFFHIKEQSEVYISVKDNFCNVLNLSERQAEKGVFVARLRGLNFVTSALSEELLPQVFLHRCHIVEGELDHIHSVEVPFGISDVSSICRVENWPMFVMVQEGTIFMCNYASFPTEVQCTKFNIPVRLVPFDFKVIYADYDEVIDVVTLFVEPSNECYYDQCRIIMYSLKHRKGDVVCNYIYSGEHIKSCTGKHKAFVYSQFYLSLYDNSMFFHECWGGKQVTCMLAHEVQNISAAGYMIAVADRHKDVIVYYLMCEKCKDESSIEKF